MQLIKELQSNLLDITASNITTDSPHWTPDHRGQKPTKTTVMTNKLILMLLLVGSTAMISAQNYNVNSNYRNGDGYSSNYSNDYYSVNSSIYKRMNRSDRRILDKLYAKLEQRERRAYRDGRISNYEARRIADIERQIEDQYIRFRSRANNSRYRSGYSYRPVDTRYNGCR